jgi:hypothetical protein
MKTIRNTSKLSLLALIILFSAFGCKSSKKAMEASNTDKDKEKLEQQAALEKRQREEEEARWRAAEEKAKREAERLAAEKRAAELRAKESTATETARLNTYFASIANSGNVTSANKSINEALAMFESPSTPVLIVISEDDGAKDYDRPTTIEKYLNYLKDQKKNINEVTQVKVNTSGKITELELTKNF